MTVAYHYREVAEDRRAGCERRAKAILRRNGLRVLAGVQVIEGRPPVDWHKGSAVLHVLRQRHGADWPSRVRALYLGDDVTDEDAFRTLRGIGRSICVAPGVQPASTLADYRVPDPAAVLQLVRWLGSGGFRAAG